MFEALVISGAVETKASTIAKVAPWAYEPFLKLVGEHPDSYRKRGDVDSRRDTQPEASAIDMVTGLSAESLLVETNVVPDIQESMDTTNTPAEPSATPLSDPEPEKVVPVG